MFKCPRCATENNFDAQSCQRCRMQFVQPAAPPQAQMISRIDCQACRTPGAMAPAKIPRFSSIIRIIGGILLVPSFLGLGFSALMLLGAITSSSSITGAESDAELAGRGIGFVMIGGFILIIGAISLASGLVGWLLLLTRKVFKCDRCGFVLDRA